MKKLLLSAFLFSMLIFCRHSLPAQKNFLHESKIVVGKQPAMILPTETLFHLHVFCMGYDANFDGVYDTEAGDEKPSWWLTNYNFPTKIEQPLFSGEAQKLRDFDFSIGTFSVRPAAAEDRIFFHQNGRIISYKLEDGTVLNNNVVEGVSPAAMSYFEQKLFLSIRRQDENDIAAVYDLNAGEFIDTINAFQNVQMTIPIRATSGGEYLIVLNEGSFGVNDSKLQIIDMLNNYNELAAIDIGGTGTFIDYFDTGEDVLIAAAMNGSHQVQLVSLNDRNIVKTFDIPSEGYDGPRELQFDKEGRRIFVTAYDGNVYQISTETEEVIIYAECSSKPEALHWDIWDVESEEYIIVTDIMQKGGYLPDSTVTIFDNIIWDSVEEIEKAQLSVYPNPASDVLNIQIPENINFDSEMQVEIYSENGNLVKSEIIISKEETQILLKNLNLISGAYYLKLINGNRVYWAPFRIVK